MTLKRQPDENIAKPIITRGITHAYTPFLVQLWDKNEQTQAELCRKIGIEQPAAVRTLDRMERDNLIKRVRSTTDRRAIKIYLTPIAQQLQTEVTACAFRINEIGGKGLTKNDKEALHLLLKKVIGNLENALEQESKYS